VTKADIIDAVVEKVGGFSKTEAADAVESVFETVKNTLEKGEKIKVVSIRPSAGGLTAALARNLAESPWHGHGCPAKERADGKALERHNSA
jgi:uncharacterized protein (DUF2267 family)